MCRSHFFLYSSILSSMFVISLVATTKASAFSFTVCTLPPSILTSSVQHVTVLNTVGNCNTVVLLYYIILYYIILYYIVMGPPSYMRSVVDRNVVMRRIPVFSDNCFRQYSLYSVLYQVNCVGSKWRNLVLCRSGVGQRNSRCLL